MFPPEKKGFDRKNFRFLEMSFFPLVDFFVVPRNLSFTDAHTSAPKLSASEHDKKNNHGLPKFLSDKYTPENYIYGWSTYPL